MFYKYNVSRPKLCFRSVANVRAPSIAYDVPTPIVPALEIEQMSSLSAEAGQQWADSDQDNPS